MSRTPRYKSQREQLVYHVQELERLAQRKRDAANDFTDGLQAAQADGFDGVTIKAVLKLRTMTPAQRSERRALEAIYLAALGMLEGEGLPDEARRRLDGRESASQPRLPDPPDASTPETTPRPPEQPPLIVKDPTEARQEGADASAAGKRIYDNPYAAGDPCRAAWDEGWCGQRKSNGMDVPQAYQRRPSPKKDDDPDRDQGGDRGGDADGKAA